MTMAVPNCFKCLLRPSRVTAVAVAVAQRIGPATVFTAPFSTSLAALGKGRPGPSPRKFGGDKQKPKTDNAKGHIRVGKTLRLSKFKKAKKMDRGKPILPGERKAFRKRVVLSNNNALRVPGLEELHAKTMRDPSMVGRMLALPNEVIDQLRAVEAFKHTQTWHMFRHPSVLLRKETVEVAEKMEAAATRKETLRMVISGDRSVGKSLLLLQAISYAYLKDWVVFHVPEGQELTNASTDYAPIPDTQPVQYSQQGYALIMIKALRKANVRLLGDLKTLFTHPDLVQHFPVGTSLLQVANSAKEPDTAWLILNALWKELTAEGSGRPPILFSVDGLSHIMKTSDYRSPSYEPIHAHDLALVGRFVDVLSGRTPLPNGGAAVAATSRGNSPRIPSMELVIARHEAAQGLLETPPVKDPYGKGYDDRVEAALGNVDVLKLDSVNKAEARALIEYWAASGLVRTVVDEKTISDKWMLGGNGNIGEIERATLMSLRY